MVIMFIDELLYYTNTIEARERDNPMLYALQGIVLALPCLAYNNRDGTNISVLIHSPFFGF